MPILLADFAELDAGDLPEGIWIVPCTRFLDEKAEDFEPVAFGLQSREEEDWRYPSFLATFSRGNSTPLVALVESLDAREWWYAPIGMEDYQALVHGAVVQRERIHGDIETTRPPTYNPDEFDYKVFLKETNLRAAFERARVVHSEIVETAEAVMAGVEIW